MPVTRFVMCLLLAVSAHAATAADLLGRYGSPVMQRFAGGHGIVVSAEFDKDGHVTAVEIAPEGFQRREPRPDLTMDRGATTELIGFLVPRDRQQRMVEDLNCMAGTSGDVKRTSCGLSLGNQDIDIERSYTVTGDVERERVATITSKTSLQQTVISMESRFGRAVAERFAVTPAISLTAMYDAARAATEVVIAPLRPMLDAGEDARFMPALEVEHILDEIAPVWTRTGKLDGFIMQSGCNGVKGETFDKVSITRSFHDCRLPEELVMQATVRWGPRRMISEGGKK